MNDAPTEHAMKHASGAGPSVQPKWRLDDRHEVASRTSAATRDDHDHDRDRDHDRSPPLTPLRAR